MTSDKFWQNKCRLPTIEFSDFKIDATGKNITCLKYWMLRTISQLRKLAISPKTPNLKLHSYTHAT